MSILFLAQLRQVKGVGPITSLAYVLTLEAVARKLAVLLHHLWVTGDVYEPLHRTETGTGTAAAAAA